MPSRIFFLVSLMAGLARAADAAKSTFVIRGTLPWRSFLSGPSAWDEADYE